mgnify:CR=1 FL=1
MKHYGAVDDPKDITTKEYVDAADNALKVKVDALWDFVCTDITSNPFQITFDDLEGLTFAAEPDEALSGWTVVVSAGREGDAYAGALDVTASETATTTPRSHRPKPPASSRTCSSSWPCPAPAASGRTASSSFRARPTTAAAPASQSKARR